MKYGKSFWKIKHKVLMGWFGIEKVVMGKINTFVPTHFLFELNLRNLILSECPCV
jgi:hypothetical protein